jgi:hypothetical protein
MVTIFMMNEEIARGMVCFFHQKKHSYLIYIYLFGVFVCLFARHSEARPYSETGGNSALAQIQCDPK